MDWSNERYVRLYVRDTKTWCLLGWEGQSLLMLLLRRLDRCGILEGVCDADDVVVVLRNGLPLEVAETGLSRLLKHGVFESRSVGLVMPKFLEAQESKQTEAQRARESRARRRDAALALRDSSVTLRDTKRQERDTTSNACHETYRQRHSVPSLAVPNKPPVVPQGDVFTVRDDVARVFDHWKATHKHPQCKLDAKRQKRILARLHEGLTPQQLCNAISGAKHDTWLMGLDPRAGRKYDGIETLLRDRGQVERLLELHEQGGRPSSKAAIDAQIKRELEWKRTHSPNRHTKPPEAPTDPWGLADSKEPPGGVSALLPGVTKPVPTASTHTGRRLTAEEIEKELNEQEAK